MKKISIIMIAVLLLGICTLGFNYKKTTIPNHCYEVFFNDELLGTIADEKELNDYIDENGEYYKNKYKVDKVYAPSGIHVRKVTTFSAEISSVSEIYSKIKKKASFTIDGYRMTIKSDDEDKDNVKIYVLDKSVFENAVVNLINSYVGEDDYQSYLDDNQAVIETTGKTIENVYVDEDITVKEVKIPVDDKIYVDEKELSKFLLYGDDYKENIYTVKAGDTLSEVAFSNKVNSSEIILANDSLTSESNLLYPGQKLKIAFTDPQISIVEESYVVSDIESEYKTEEKYDSSILIGDEKVEQEGKNGLDRVSQEVKTVNGEIVYVNPKEKQVLKSPVNKVIVKGSKYVSGVGSLTNWSWPTDSGWTLSSNYAYRSNPFGGGRELHTGLDISGTGYGSKIYATNNGKVVTATYHYSYGNYVVIDHNNGYLTVYAHMSKIAAKVGQIVERGQVIGYVGCTGSCTGPHVHYEVWKGCNYCHVNPSVLYLGGYR